MKLLVGAACVAIIAFVGYYFWKEYRANEAFDRYAFSAKCDKLIEEGKRLDISTISDAEKVRKRRSINECIQFLQTGKLPTQP